MPRPVVMRKGRAAPEKRLRFYLPDAKRRDPDNLLKLIHDAMSRIVYHDDHQIRRQVWEVAA